MCPFLLIHKNPVSPCVYVIWGAVLCNIAAFSFYSYLQIMAKREAAAMQTTKLVENQESGSEDTSSDGSE